MMVHTGAPVAISARRLPLRLSGGLALVLLTGILFQWRSANVREAYPRSAPLTMILPETAPGWTVMDEPVAETEEIKRAVAEMLNFDEAIVRTYRRGKDSLSVYVAYWRPGRIHPRLIAQHTPDICWPGAGWEVKGKGTSPILSGSGGQTPPGQIRIFSIKGHLLHVVFWHLVGGDANRGIDPTGLSFFRYLRSDLQSGQREQYFIRLSSTVPYEQLQDEPLFIGVMHKLATLGLTKPAIPK